MVYSTNYEGYYIMSHHDREENALKRWFDNFKVDRNAWFATEFETLIVVDVPATAKHITKRQICQIENPGYIKHNVKHYACTREVCMDHTAPPAPMLTFAAKRIWQPPPPKSAEDRRKEAEYERMYRNGFEPRYIRRAVYSPLTTFSFNETPDFSESSINYVEEVQWVKRNNDQSDAMRMVMEMITTPPAFDKSILQQLKSMAPKHRRNN